MENTLTDPETKGKERLIALDILRGLTIMFMIIVNNPGLGEDQSFPPLLHAKWNGFTPTDFVFPSFIFIVGVSTVLAYSRQLAKGVPGKKMVKKIITRTLILLLLGMFLSILPSFNIKNIRFPGVLQRIGIVYFCCAMLYLFTSEKFQVWLAVVILVGYFIIMTMVPVPGYGYSILEPGKNMAAWLDSIALPGRMWQGTWDPEGILSTFPAIITGVLGMFAGRLTVSDKTTERKIIWLFLCGFISFVAANIWDWVFPINKNLWTSSFVLYTAGLSCLTLASLYFIVDVLGYKRWAKFALIFGSNAIAAYLSAEVIYYFVFFPWSHGSRSFSEVVTQVVLDMNVRPQIVSFAFALFFGALCFMPVLILYRKKIFLKI